LDRGAPAIPSTPLPGALPVCGWPAPSSDVTSVLPLGALLAFAAVMLAAEGELRPVERMGVWVQLVALLALLAGPGGVLD
jgi:hypothetical protein